jgi:TRAP-type C4-dicarboxylate transport system substrate-binding protein
MRIRFLFLFVLALSLSLLPHAPTHAQQSAVQTRTLTFATLAPPGSLIMRGLDAWNREIRRRTDRALQFRFYAGGVQGDEPEVIRKIRSGRLDAGHVTSSGFAQIHRPALVFQLPGTFRRYEQLEAARAALAPEIEQGMIGQGFHMLGWADVGQAHLFSNRPVRSPADLASCRFWVRTDDIILPRLFDIVRSTPVTLTVPEVLAGLQTSRIDTFLAPPAIAIALQWSAHATHMSDMPFAILVGGTAISERTFQSLPAEQRTILAETSAQFHGLARRNAARVERESIDAMVSRGLTVVPAGPADVAEWRRVGRELRDQVASQIATPELVARAASFGEQ